jgi:hypothetical protein
MNRESIKQFLNDPLVREAMKTDGRQEVGRMAMMAGNLERNQDLREFGQRLLGAKDNE